MHSHTFNLRNVRHLLKRAKELELNDGAVQRLKWFSYALEHESNVSLTCRHFGIARSTFVRWAKRFDARDVTSLEEESRSPHTVREPEIAMHVVALIRDIRLQHPLLSKDAIAELLKRQYGVSISASSVGRTIARYGFFFAATKSHEQKRQSAPLRDHFGAPSASDLEVSGTAAFSPLHPIDPLAS